MSNIVAGIGRGQLLHLEEHLARKTEIYNYYKKGFEDCPLSMNPYINDTVPNFWLSCILLDKSVKTTIYDIMEKLNEINIDSRPLWKPMHAQPVFADNDFISVNEDAVTDDLFSRGICLPSDIKMTEEQQNTIIDLVKSMI
jgi:dTDP-4-amino-4,6-dideoxygalactose transaminase